MFQSTSELIEKEPVVIKNIYNWIDHHMDKWYHDANDYTTWYRQKNPGAGFGIETAINAHPYYIEYKYQLNIFYHAFDRAYILFRDYREDFNNAIEEFEYTSSDILNQLSRNKEQYTNDLLNISLPSYDYHLTHENTKYSFSFNSQKFQFRDFIYDIDFIGKQMRRISLKLQENGRSERDADSLLTRDFAEFIYLRLVLAYIDDRIINPDNYIVDKNEIQINKRPIINSSFRWLKTNNRDIELEKLYQLLIDQHLININTEFNDFKEIFNGSTFKQVQWTENEALLVYFLDNLAGKINNSDYENRFSIGSKCFYKGKPNDLKNTQLSRTRYNYIKINKNSKPERFLIVDNILKVINNPV